MMLAHEVNMQRLRLKADGRIVELRDGQEFPLAPTMPGPHLRLPGPSIFHRLPRRRALHPGEARLAGGARPGAAARS
jgi:hypothetical protein